MKAQQLEKLLDNLAENVGVIGVMVYTESVSMADAHTLIDGMMLLAIKEYSMNEKLAQKVTETLHKELEECVEELEKI